MPSEWQKWNICTLLIYSFVILFFECILFLYEFHLRNSCWVVGAYVSQELYPILAAITMFFTLVMLDVVLCAILLMKHYFMDEICQTIKQATVYSFHVPPYLHGLIFFSTFFYSMLEYRDQKKLHGLKTLQKKNRTRQRWTEQWQEHEKGQRNGKKIVIKDAEINTEYERPNERIKNLQYCPDSQCVQIWFIQFYFDFGFVFHFVIFNRFCSHPFCVFIEISTNFSFAPIVHSFGDERIFTVKTFYTFYCSTHSFTFIRHSSYTEIWFNDDKLDSSQESSRK